jgi:sulfur dioxygenase
MIFRQLFDSVSGTYTYLIASRHGAAGDIRMLLLARRDAFF